MPYAAPNKIEMYIDPGKENVWTLHLSQSDLGAPYKRYDTIPHPMMRKG